MIIGILQLSDIHMQLKDNSILQKQDFIPKAIQENIFELEYLFITITGDSAFSGKSEEYIIVRNMIEKISEGIKKIRKDINIHYIIIPGNHDCDFSSAKPSIRKTLVETIKEENIEYVEEEFIDEIIEVQTEYFKFQSIFEMGNKKIDTKLFKSYLFNLEDFSIVFNCFNSAWISSLEEKPGTLNYPIKRNVEYLSNLKSDLIISTIHHPKNWYSPNNSREIGTVLEKYSDIILTGHEHVSTANEVKNLKSGEYTQYIEGGVLQENWNAEISMFNLIQFNLTDKLQKISEYSWKKTYYSNISETEWLYFNRSGNLNKTFFELSDNYMQFLNDPGMTITHPRKEKIQLQDVYIYPHAKIINFTNKKNKTEQLIDLSKLKKYKKFKFLILGNERSGKTTLCKSLYKHYYNDGYVPIIIDSKKIKGNTIGEFNKQVYSDYVEQYSENTLEHYKQLEQEKKIIIIDDWEKLKQNNKFKLIMLKNIIKIYPNIILTGENILNYFDLIDNRDDDSMFDEFEKFEIKQLGHYKRTELINKWITLGQENVLKEKELIEKHDQILTDMNVVIGNNFVPSYPFFILIILQTSESNTPHNNKDSAYGYYYEWLITQSFIDLNVQHKDIDAYYTYISELAYYFFDKKINEITTLDLENFNRYYDESYDLTNDFKKMIKRLEKSSVIELKGEYYSFKYNYVYYYFVAKYFSRNIAEIKIREIISKLCKNIHVEEYSNILMFLTHLSKDPFILIEINNQAKKVFDNFSPTTLEKDILSLNNLIVEIPKAVYKNIEVKKHREERLIAMDKLENENNVDKINKSHNNKNISDTFAKLNVAFKTIEILGQILKNYYGSIKGEQKYVLTESGYMIGLRTLNSFLSLISDHVELIAVRIQKIIEEQEAPNTKEGIENRARKILFELSCTMAYGIIKKVSESVGTKDLYKTYKKITENHNFTSVKLIEISIKLDKSRTIPFSEIKNLKEDSEKNIMALSLLQNFVLEHLYMYDTNYSDKDRICNLLDISMEKQRAIDLSSDRKKIYLN